MSILLLLSCSVPTSDFEVFGGFHLGWESLSHRVSRLEAGIGPDGPKMAMVGGDWSTGESYSDWLHYRMASVEVRGARAGFAQIRVPLSVEARGLDESGEFLREGVAVGVAELPLIEVGAWPVYSAVIQGFGIRSDVAQGASFPADYDSSHGYALGRLQLRVGEPTKGEEAVTVEASLQFEPASTEESILDRPAMNASIPDARFEGWVDVGILGHEREGTSLPLQASVEHPYLPPYSPQEPVRLAVDFERGRLAAWTSLDFEVNPGGPGDYIRTIGAEILGQEDLEAVGMDLTNSSAYELAPFSYSIEGNLTLVPIGRQAEILLRSREGEADVGDWIP